jgi:deoxyribodipyrimidine photolyase-related protein
MTKIFIILPTQLFHSNNSILDEIDIIYLIEEPYYFTSRPFHKQKIMLHRASMKYYYDYLNSNSKLKDKIRYIEFDEFSKIKKRKDDEFYMYDPIDNEMIEKYSKLFKIKFHHSPSFLETREELDEYRNKFTRFLW